MQTKLPTIKESEPKLTPISTGHRVGFIALSPSEVADLELGTLENATARGRVYAVCNFGDKKIPFLYTAKVKFGNKSEWLVWYRSSKKLWNSYGKTRMAAVEGAVKDGWLYA